MSYLWIKALHIIFMVTWFAGLFYLPRLFVYHVESSNKNELDDAWKKSCINENVLDPCKACIGCSINCLSFLLS